MDSLYHIQRTNEEAVQHALKRERAELQDLIEDINHALVILKSGRAFNRETKADQLLQLGFCHQTLGNSMRFRAEHGLL